MTESPLKENTQREYAPAASPVSTGQEVPRESLLKGYEVGRNQYVTLSPEELKALEDATNQHAEIQEFVPLDTVDPVFFERTYYLGPDKGGEKPYWPVGRALRDSNSGAVAKLVMRGKEKMVFIRPTDENRLILEVLYWGDEVRDFSEVSIPELALKDQEVSLAGKLIESLSSEQWDPHKYHDTYRERVLELIQKKQQGQEIVAPQPRPEGEVSGSHGSVEAKPSERRRKEEGARQGRTASSAPQRRKRKTS